MGPTCKRGWNPVYRDPAQSLGDFCQWQSGDSQPEIPVSALFPHLCDVKPQSALFAAEFFR
jgi:hypothetical protein